MNRQHALRILSWFLLFSLCTSKAVAQEITGSISGVVSDSSGALIPGVKVTVTNTGTNVSKTVVTGASGAYRVPFLFFGTYQVKAEHEGFKTSQMDKVDALDQRRCPGRSHPGRWRSD